MQRFTSRKSLVDTDEHWDQAVDKNFTFAQRDLVIVHYRPAAYHVDFAPHIFTRGLGNLVLLVGPNESARFFTASFISIDKRASAFEVTPAQAIMIDSGVAVGLLTLAIGSLFVGRKRRTVQRTSETPI